VRSLLLYVCMIAPQARISPDYADF
jgi:hypothetical protein